MQMSHRDVPCFDRGTCSTPDHFVTTDEAVVTTDEAAVEAAMLLLAGHGRKLVAARRPQMSEAELALVEMWIYGAIQVQVFEPDLEDAAMLETVEVEAD